MMTTMTMFEGTRTLMRRGHYPGSVSSTLFTSHGLWRLGFSTLVPLVLFGYPLVNRLGRHHYSHVALATTQHEESFIFTLF